jgi:hypothetical protein
MRTSECYIVYITEALAALAALAHDLLGLKDPAPRPRSLALYNYPHHWRVLSNIAII